MAWPYRGVWMGCNKAGKNKPMVELESLLDSIPAGVVRAVAAGGLRIEYANREFYRQLGYSPEEFAGGEIQSEYLQVVYPEDRTLLFTRALDYANSDRESVAVEYRVLAKSGEIKWMRAVAAARLFDPDEPNPVLQGVITDITEEHERRLAIELSEERYRIIAEQTRDTVFDWDLESDRIQFSPVYEKMFGFMPPPDISVRSLTEYDIVFEDDKPRVQEMIDAVLGGAPHAEARYRAKCADGSYLWCRNRVTTIFDGNGKPIRAVGLLSDIDDEVKKTESLQEQALHDSLTGLLNRMSFQHKVEQELREHALGRHAFLLLDADRFKQINDTRGHAAGDAVLQMIAEQMKGTFRMTDLFGRMGGDEFAAFLPNVSSVASVTEKAQQLLRRTAKNAPAGTFATLSLGMAVYPRDGENFEELYRLADDALYAAKRKGGNAVCAASPETENIR